MMMNKFALITGILALGLILSLSPLVGAPTSEVETTPSTASVSSTVAIGKSTELTTGIAFGSLNPNTADNNGTKNFNASDQTEYWIEVETASNTNVDLCIGSDVDLTKSGDTISNTGYTFSDSTTNDQTNPTQPSTLTIGAAGGYDSVQDNVAEGKTYLRFHLDVPSDQAAGDYSNCVSFKATVTGSACTSGVPGGC